MPKLSAPEETRKKLKTKALKAIKKHRLYRINQIAPYIGVSRKTLYNHTLNSDEDITDALDSQCIKRKMELIERMEYSKSSSDKIAILRMLADPEELQRLNTRHEISGPKEEDIRINHAITFDSENLKKLSTNELDSLEAILKQVVGVEDNK